jgi:hypothetical protein
MKVQINYTIDVDAEDVLSLMHSHEAVEPMRDFLGDVMAAVAVQWLDECIHNELGTYHTTRIVKQR